MHLMLACRPRRVRNSHKISATLFTLSLSLAREDRENFDRKDLVRRSSRESRVFVSHRKVTIAVSERRQRDEGNFFHYRRETYHNCISCINVVRFSCGAVRGRSCLARILGHLPDDGSFSAVTHVAMQNTGIARAWSILLRRRRGYVNWGVRVNGGRRDAYRSTLPPTTRAPACCLLPWISRLSQLVGRFYPRAIWGPDICLRLSRAIQRGEHGKTQKHTFCVYNLGEREIYAVIAWEAYVLCICARRLLI